MELGFQTKKAERSAEEQMNYYKEPENTVFQIDERLSLFYNEQKDEKILWTFDEKGENLVKLSATKGEIPPAAKSLFPRLGLDKQRKDENFILPRVVSADMEHVPCVKILDRSLELAILDKSNKLISIKKIEIMPVLYQQALPISQLVMNHAKPNYHKLKISQSSPVREDQTQDVLIAIRLNENVLIMEEFMIDYKTKEASLIGSKHLFTKTRISDNGWKVLPMFHQKDSVICQGNIIYHKNKSWDVLVRIDKFLKADYIFTNEIGSVGYDLEPDSILTKSILNHRFSTNDEISYNEKRYVLDRMDVALSNTAPNRSFLSPKDHLLQKC